MNSQKNILGFMFVTYCLSYFLLSTAFYFISISIGNEGLGVPLVGGGDDGFFYMEQAKNIVYDRPAILTSIHSVLLGYILKVFNTENVIILKYFNFFGNILLAFVALIILRKSLDKRQSYSSSAIILILFLLFYPSLLLNSNLSIYRDVWICLYLLWSVLLFANLFIKRGRLPIVINLLLLMSTMAMLGSYRKYALLSFVISSGLYFLFCYRKKKNIRFEKVIISGFIGFSLAYMFFRSFKVPFLNLSFQDVLNYRQFALEAGGSQMGISLDHSNIIYFYINYFYSIISNTIGPLPWQVNSLATLIVFFTESIIFVIIILFLFKQRKSFSNLDLYLIIQSIIWFMLISISNDNLGTASRLRIVGWLPLIIVFSKYFGQYLFLRKQGKKARGVLN